MNFYNHIIETIGNTPMVKLNKVVDTEALVLAKIESFNPGHSTKDRMALKMIEDAEKDGLLEEGGTVIEGTSGNTGIGIVYDSNAEKIVIHYEDSGDSNYSKLIVGTVSGTSISFAGELTTYTTNTIYQNAIFDSTNNRVVLVWNNFAKVYNNAEDLSGSLSHDAVTAGTALSATKLLVKG